MIAPLNASNPQTLSNQKLRETAQNLEVSFLAEMLRHSGLNARTGAFSGGVGEQQYSSFLREAQAKHLVSGGGIGLAESLFEALKARQQ